MSTIFEQPKHLNAVSYRRLIRAFRPVLIGYASALTALVLIGLWRRAEAGQHVSVLDWTLGATIGLLAAGLTRLGLRLEVSRRRYIEFRERGLFLAGRGVIALRRIANWALLPDSAEPRYTRLEISYRFGLGRKRWSMLLDDDTQIAALRNALAVHIPPTRAV